MNHSDMVAEIMTRAAAHGLLSHYCLQSRTCLGVAGLPDIIVAGPYAAVWLEVKAGSDTLSPAQTTWFHTLTAGGHSPHVIREADMSGDMLNGLLSRCAGVSRRHDSGVCYGSGCDHVSHG